MSNEPKTINEVLGQLAGYASLCWEPRPTGVFDSTEASKGVELARQELVRRIEGKKKFYCEIHGIKQRRDKCIRCCETFMYREALDEVIKEIS